MDILSSFLHYTYVTLNAILILCIIILSALIATKLYKIIFVKVNEKKELIRFKRGILRPMDLFELTDLEFNNWCVNFLKRLDYNDVKLCNESIDSNSMKNITCKKEDITLYIHCKRYPYKKSSNDKVTVKDIKCLLGAMICDNVTNGIMITTGFLSKEAQIYLPTIPKNYNIANN